MEKRKKSGSTRKQEKKEELPTPSQDELDSLAQQIGK
jgi:hypothetical protein